MAVPNKNLEVIMKKQLNSERVSLVERIRQNETFLPKGVLHADLDKGFIDFANTNLSLTINGEKVPVIFLSLQNWNEFSKTWQFTDKYTNVQMPFITIVRDTNIVLSEQQKYNIPHLYKKPILKVPVWNGNRNGYDIYEIPQPINVDVSYEVRLFSTRMRELNEFNKKVLTEFSSLQAYTSINGHYTSITLDNVGDEHEINDINRKRFYVQKYDMKLHGFLLDENEFVIKPAVTRTILNYKFIGSKNGGRKKPNIMMNKTNDGKLEIEIVFFANSPLNVSFIADSEYSINFVDNQNIMTYEIKKNGVNVQPTFNVISGDIIEINLTQNDSNSNSTLNLYGTFNANYNLENLITDTDTNISGYYFEKKTSYVLTYDPGTSSLSYTNLYGGILKEINNVKSNVTSYTVFKNNVIVNLPIAVAINDTIKINVVRTDVSQPTNLTAVQTFNNELINING
jgi:hypothetical protein